MDVIAGSASGLLGARVAVELNSRVVPTEIRRFPDGEAYVRVSEDLAGREVAVLQTTWPDPHLVEALLLRDAVLSLKPRRAVLVVPYFAYARQDRRFKHGEALSSIALGRTLAEGWDDVLTIDIHEASLLPQISPRARNISALGEIGKYLAGKGADLVVSPDEGSLDRVRPVAEAMGVPFDHLVKTRHDGERVEIAPKALHAKGKRVAIIDDIISTGGTIAAAAKALKDAGAREVVAACTHGLYAGGALKKLHGVLDDLVSTDTVESATSRVSAAPAVARALA
jgi:ribose-phosphate pyrophosphokinase